MRSCCVYIARCADGTYYTGATTDLAARLALHNAGGGAKYVRGRTPIAVVYVQPCRTYGQALRIERTVKRLTRQQKRQLIRGLRKLRRPSPRLPRETRGGQGHHPRWRGRVDNRGVVDP